MAFELSLLWEESKDERGMRMSSSQNAEENNKVVKDSWWGLVLISSMFLAALIVTARFL